MGHPPGLEVPTYLIDSRQLLFNMRDSDVLTQLQVVIRVFAVQRFVQPDFFSLFNLHRREQIDDLQHAVGEHECPHRREHHRDHLLEEEAGLP